MNKQKGYSQGRKKREWEKKVSKRASSPLKRPPGANVAPKSKDDSHGTNGNSEWILFLQSAKGRASFQGPHYLSWTRGRAGRGKVEINRGNFHGRKKERIPSHDYHSEGGGRPLAHRRKEEERNSRTFISGREF